MFFTDQGDYSEEQHNKDQPMNWVAWLGLAFVLVVAVLCCAGLIV